MKDISMISNSAITEIQNKSDIFAKTRSESMTDEQKQAVKYFFARLQRIYQAEYRRQIPDESTSRAVRQEFADRIMNISKALMDKGFDNLHDELCDPESSYKFMKLDAVIELVKMGGNSKGVQDGAHRIFPKALPEPKEHKEKRRKVAIEACSRIKSIFDE